MMKIEINRLLILCIISTLFICLISLVLFKCLRSNAHQFDQSYCKCKGLNDEIKSRIINGTFVKKGDLPWVASIFVKALQYVTIKGLFFIFLLCILFYFILKLYFFLFLKFLNRKWPFKKGSEIDRPVLLHGF